MYGQWLETAGLTTLELQRLHANLTMCYKIVFGLINLTFADFFSFSPVTATVGHNYKLYVNYCKDVRQRFFVERVFGLWNRLPVSVDFTILHRFKHSILKVDFKKFLTMNVDG